MIDISDNERRRVFSIWLRTGRLPSLRNAEGVELKFNPWHDPETGRFTFVGAGRIIASGAAVDFLVAEAARVAVAARPVQETGPGHPGQDRKSRQTVPFPKTGCAPPKATTSRLTSRTPNAQGLVAGFREAAVASVELERARRERGDHLIQTVVRRTHQVRQPQLCPRIALPRRTEPPPDPQARPAKSSARSCATAILTKSMRASGRGAFLVR